MSMVKVERNERIEAPIGQVFDQATDLERFNEWMPKNGVFRSCELITSGPVGSGTAYVDRGLMGTFAGEVIEHERPSRVVYRERLRWLGRPVADVLITYQFRPAPGGTIVHHVVESEFHGVFSLMAPLARMIGPGERRRTLQGLKRSAESQGAACDWSPPKMTEERPAA